MKTDSKREKEHSTMLQEALARPGVREVMEIYGNWQKEARCLDINRAAAKEPEQVVTTNCTNAC